MPDEQHVSEASNDINKEANNLIESMSGLYIDHRITINDCHGQYFQQKYRKFQEIEKLIGMLVETFSSRANEAQDFKEIKISQDVHKLRQEFLFFIIERFRFVQRISFGLKSISIDSESDRPTITKAVARKDDNFCDFILKADDGITMVGYGILNSSYSTTANVKFPMLESSKNSESTTVSKVTKTREYSKASLIKASKLGEYFRNAASTEAVKVTKTGECATVDIRPPKVGESSKTAASTANVRATKTEESTKIIVKPHKMKESSKTLVSIFVKSPKIGESFKIAQPSAIAKVTKTVDFGTYVVKPLKIGESSKAAASTADVKATKIGECSTSVQIPKIGKSETVQSPKVEASATMENSQGMDKSMSGNHVEPIRIEEENPYAAIRCPERRAFHPRLRLKKNLMSMMRPKKVEDDDDEVKMKRRRSRQ